MAIQYMFGVPVTISEPKPAPPADNRIWSLYVGDLDPQVTEAAVNFFTFLHASTALTFLNHKELKGQSIRIMWSERLPLTRKMGMANLFVKNLHLSFTSGQLQSMFFKFGRILSCTVTSENGNSKGFGFVQFDSEQSAMTACNALHGRLLKGKRMAQQEGIDNCHTEKLKAPSLQAKNSTHPVHHFSFYSLGKDLIKQRQQIDTGTQSFKSEFSACGNNFVKVT